MLTATVGVRTRFSGGSRQESLVAFVDDAEPSLVPYRSRFWSKESVGALGGGAGAAGGTEVEPDPGFCAKLAPAVITKPQTSRERSLRRRGTFLKDIKASSSSCYRYIYERPN